MRYHMSNRQGSKGFTVAELMVATGVFLIAIVGVLYSFLKCQELAELGRNSSLAVQGCRNLMETIKSTSFNTIPATYNNSTFTITNMNGKGVVYVDSSNASFIQIKIVFCWKQQQGLLVGEDKNLNGVLNAGEDANGNGQLDSYVQMRTAIYG